MTGSRSGVFRHQFSAMASPCEVQVECADPAEARELGMAAEREAIRIEQKFSRYRDDSVVARINASNGLPVVLDDETAGLIDYAQNCWQLSEGRFDITSGVLRHVWKFDGSDKVPSREAVEAIRPLVGWDKVEWAKPGLTMPAGMEIDLGGIGKEYAVDRATIEIMKLSKAPVMVNFGGDLRITRPHLDGSSWNILIESVDQSRVGEGVVGIAQGALATSGDARRFLRKDGVRYSHILDPRTGWPVANPPRSITVAARTCMEAGTLSTLAMLQGIAAEKFLSNEGVKSWVIW